MGQPAKGPLHDSLAKTCLPSRVYRVIIEGATHSLGPESIVCARLVA